MRFISTIVKIFVLGIAIIGLLYFGACVYGNVSALNSNPLHAPDANDAQYSISIKNTGNLLYSDSVSQDGDIITLDGFWTLIGQKWQHKDTIVVLDQSIFGPITVRVRGR